MVFVSVPTPVFVPVFVFVLVLVLVFVAPPVVVVSELPPNMSSRGTSDGGAGVGWASWPAWCAETDEPRRKALTDRRTRHLARDREVNMGKAKRKAEVGKSREIIPAGGDDDVTKVASCA